MHFNIEELVAADPVLGAALEELAEKEWHLRMMKAQREQEELAQAGLLEARAVDGLGEVTRRVHSQAYHDWAIKEGSPECPAYEVWQDKSFNRYFDKLAPETKVKSKGTRIQVGHQGPETHWPVQIRNVDPSGNRRFHKSYG